MMFGFGRSREEKERDQRQSFLQAANQGLDMFGPDRANYQLQGLEGYQRQGQMGQNAEGALLRDLTQRSAGGYGRGEAMFLQAADNTARRAMGDALSVDGLSPAAAANMAARNAVQARLGAGAQAAAIRASEQQFADQARMGLATGMANRGLGANQVQLGANQQFNADQRAAANMFLNPTANAMEGDANRRQQRNNMLIGGLFQAGGAIGGALASDENLKENVDRDSTGGDADSFLDALDTASYTYKSEKHGKGKHYSAMAQSVAKSELGRTFVERNEDGLMLDTRKGFGALLVSSKRLHDRIKKLEKKAG
ncbi:MAG: hypothetical protein AAF654_14820 [Myxococcota bacterium]